MEINEQIINYYFNKGMYNAYWNDTKFSHSITAEVSFEELINIIERRIGSSFIGVSGASF